MNRAAGLLMVVGAIHVTSADPITVYVNDFASLDGVTTRDPLGAPYLAFGGAMADVGPSDAGYLVMDIAMVPIDEGFPLYTEGMGTIDVQLRWEADPSDPSLIPDTPRVFCMRVYSSVPDPNTGEWVFSGSQNYFFNVEPAIGDWNYFSRPAEDWDETDGWGTFNPESIYKFRIDYVSWDADYHPCSFGIGHVAFIQPECPRDLDDDDDVDASDLAVLLAEYGCGPEVTTLYDSGGFEDFELGDIAGQDGWENVGSDSSGIVTSDPTGSGMGNVVKMDATDGFSRAVKIQRLIDTPMTNGVVIYEWDQYREDLGDNVWHCDDAAYDGWWSLQWDVMDPHTISANGWPGAGSEIHAGVWEHVKFELNLNEGQARVAVDDVWSEVANFTTDDMKGIEFEIQDTEIAGNGAIYYDNVTMAVQTICSIDYNYDGYTDLSDLAHLLAVFGCGTE